MNNVEPKSAALAVGDTQKFVVQPAPVANMPVTWAATGNVQGSTDAHGVYRPVTPSALGKIDALGAYTACARGTDIVVAKDSHGVLLGSSTVTIL